MHSLLLKSFFALVAAQSVFGSSWFGRTGTSEALSCFGGRIEAVLLSDNLVYNKWHETELERWLSDNNIPYPTPADRKDLENVIKDNWNNYVVTPYNSWDSTQLQKYIALKGEDVKKGAEKNKEELIKQVKESWTDTEDHVNDAYNSVRDWIFDTYEAHR